MALRWQRISLVFIKYGFTQRFCTKVISLTLADRLLEMLLTFRNELYDQQQRPISKSCLHFRPVSNKAPEMPNTPINKNQSKLLTLHFFANPFCYALGWVWKVVSGDTPGVVNLISHRVLRTPDAGQQLLVLHFYTCLQDFVAKMMHNEVKMSVLSLFPFYLLDFNHFDMWNIV